MYVRLKYSKKAKHPTMQIVEGVREGNKVKQRTIAHLGVVKGEKDLRKLKKLAENLIERLEKEGLPAEPKVTLEAIKHKKTTYDGFSLVVDKLMDITGFTDVIQSRQGRRKFNVAEIVKLILMQRFDTPSSKLRTYERQTEHGFNEVDLQHIYRAMDAIEGLEGEIQKQAFCTVNKYLGEPVDCFFFDVTTLYFESVKQDSLRDFGFSKDQKYHSVQIVFALVVDSQGMPLAYETFKGNLAETKTLIPVLEKLRERFSVTNVTVVCDRGLASKTNVEALQTSQFHFVIASKLRAMSKKLKLNDLATYTAMPNQDHIPEEERTFFRLLPHPQYSDTTLISTYSPSRAHKDREDRDRLLAKLRKKIDNSSEESTVKNVISNGAYKKFTTVKAGSMITINEKAVQADALWDGFHGIAVANSAKLSPEGALSRYRDLWHVEEAFRVAKTTLKTRPIFHWVSHRIEAHMLLCFMNLFLERFLELLLRKNDLPLTPDRIRHALSLVHTTIFEDESTGREGLMRSVLSEDAQKIFQTLGIPIERTTILKN